MKLNIPWTHIFAFLGAVLSTAAYAQGYPVKTVRYIVPSLPGGGSDIVGRMMAAHLSQTFKQQVVVDNRAGGGGNIGAEIAAKSMPDGHTIFQMAVTHTINVTLYKNLAYDLVRDFTPITRLASSPLVVTVHPSLSVKTLADLIHATKAKPGGINFASAGTGTPTHMAVELFNRRTGIELVHVPYKGGGGAQSSILAGETQIYFANIVTAMPHVQSGRLRALAVTSPKRVPLIPEYPTIAESGYPGYESETWFGLMLPVKTPKNVVAAVRSAALAALHAPEVNKRLIELAFIPIGDSAAEFTTYIQSEIATYGKLVRELKVTSE
jgi:tripartite-type tricarboxylate transporter receptor subunit TctC